MDCLSGFKFLIFITQSSSIRQKIGNEIPIFESIDKRFDSIDKKFDSIDKKFESIDKKLDSIDERLKIIELKQDRMAGKLDDLQFQFKVFERTTKKSIHKLQDEMETVIEILRQNEMIPIPQ